ncbi:ammonium transporter [Advenella sp. WQ 585]|uniref:Ammonium transporter n=1 Tax=Advenella mandrilli TaxID=2800330 RepID=A0ABS1EGN5_9BURK|nr:ammonium transporter [Advenella mandrilli]MBK1782168.1 ammonium transporter [Advenella mandrilli]
MDKADLVWVSISTILVLLMVIPGLAMFYGGLVRSKNILSVMSHVLVTFALVIILWFAYGYSLAFSDGNAFFGGLSRLFFSGMYDIGNDTFELSGSIPELSFAAFQATFAGITCALIIGGFAERIKFSAVLVFMAIWLTFSYIPVAHMIWSSTGLLSGAALDFAGGTVVHINAGVAALVAAYMIGPRLGYGKEAMQPHNLTMTMTGAALLWVGWFGFNAGSALGANTQAALAFFNTLLATSGAIIAWVLAEWKMKGNPSLLGAASGAVAGLVGITPAAGLVGPAGALIIGFMTSLFCLWGVNGLKRLLRADDSLDVFGIHGVGGIVGGLLTGIFNAKPLGGPGLETVGDIPWQVWLQLEGMLITAAWCAIVTFIALKIAGLLTGGIRVEKDAERQGLDITHHGEQGYHF